MRVNVLNEQDDIFLDTGFFDDVSAYISDKFDRDKNCEVNIIFVSPLQIRQLNKQYRQKDSETDVLSFCYLSGDDGESVPDGNKGFYTLGEIIICPAVADENISDKEAWSLNTELSLLIIHGFLHLYDYDHERKEDREKMFDIQNSMLEDVRKKFKLS